MSSASHGERLADLSVREVPFQEPPAVFAAFAGDRGTVFFDSALTTERLGRYSFIAAEPFSLLSSKDGIVTLDGKSIPGDPFDVLAEQIARFPVAGHSELPPFQTGAAGFLGYDLGRHLERLPVAANDDMAFPDMAVGFYDTVIAFDHREKRAWILSCGHPEPDARARRERASARIDHFLSRMAAAPKDLPSLAPPAEAPAVESNFNRPDYEAAVQRVIDYIFAGDIFQANLTQRFRATLPKSFTTYDLYRRLRSLNPAPFGAYLDLAGTVIASSSPERFLKLLDGRVETRPIKGTRPRGASSAEDDALALELLASEKDRAENVMIVDLLRNDLSRVCRDDSIEVPELCVLEAYATVFHLVSTVVGELVPGATAVDLIKASFPGGSITGAPKIRAMEIIAELEPTQRGPYCGSIGYLSFTGAMDSNIAIRTFAIKDDIVTFQAGGGIVADSRPDLEFQETLDKAKALIATLSPDARSS